LRVFSGMAAQKPVVSELTGESYRSKKWQTWSGFLPACVCNQRRNKELCSYRTETPRSDWNRERKPAIRVARGAPELSAQGSKCLGTARTSGPPSVMTEIHPCSSN